MKQINFFLILLFILLNNCSFTVTGEPGHFTVNMDYSFALEKKDSDIQEDQLFDSEIIEIENDIENNETETKTEIEKLDSFVETEELENDIEEEIKIIEKDDFEIQDDIHETTDVEVEATTETQEEISPDIIETEEETLPELKEIEEYVEPDCDIDKDCDDDNMCTVDYCEYGICEHIQKENCCLNNEDCPEIEKHCSEDQNTVFQSNGCIDNKCSTTILETCYYGCKNGECLPECTNNYDCNSDYMCKDNQCIPKPSCEASKYWEEALNKCLSYPDFDNSGTWELKMLPIGTYTVDIDQNKSYFEVNFWNNEIENIAGTLQGNFFEMSGTKFNNTYKTYEFFGTQESSIKISGFCKITEYTETGEELKIETPPFTLKKL